MFLNDLLTQTDKLGVPADERNWNFGRVQFSNVDSQLGNEETVLFPKIKYDESGQTVLSTKPSKNVK